MPYTGPGDDTLPDNIKKLAEPKRAQWVAVFNSAHEKCAAQENAGDDCEAVAFRMANGVLFKEMALFTPPVDTGLSGMLSAAQVGELGTWANKLTTKLSEATWTAAFVNNLPDSSFLHILPGGEKDEEGKTTPRSLRMFPYKDASGKVDLPHLRNALARIPQSNRIDAATKKRLTNKARDELQKDQPKELESMDPIYILSEIERLAGGYNVGEVNGSLRDTANRIEDAFHAAFSPEDRWEGPYRVQDVFMDHPTLGNSIVVLDKKAGVSQAATYTDTGAAVEFAPRVEWKPVELVYQFTQAPSSESDDLNESDINIAEFDGCAMEVTEQGDIATGGSKPLVMTIRPIKAGWGNPRDNHFYPLAMLKEHFATAYDGVKMFETNHVNSETNNRNWVSTYMETKDVDGVGPVGRVGVHDPLFAQKVLNLQALGLLEKLECSIRGPGKAVAFEKDGRKGKQVQELDRGLSIDWVSRGGAGGQALPLAESEEGTMDKEKKKDKLQETEPVQVEENNEPQGSGPITTLEAEVVTAKLAESKLPVAFKAALAQVTYQDEAALTEAIAQAVKEVKVLTGSGQPSGVGASEPVGATSLTEAEIEEKRTARFNAIMAEVGLKGV